MNGLNRIPVRIVQSILKGCIRRRTAIFSSKKLLILDAGIGPGHLAILINRFFGHEVIGVDIEDCREY